MIYIVNKRNKLENIKKKYPDALILDLTSSSQYLGLRILSPFYPHGGVPIPFTDGIYATCVEAVWQGLKVFENAGVDFNMFNNGTMKNLKRTVRRFGKPLGHAKGAFNSAELLDYGTARKEIYLPTYLWVIENIESVRNVVAKISEKSENTDLVFLDYNTNENLDNFKKPLSHAALIKKYIEGTYPGMIAKAVKKVHKSQEVLDVTLFDDLI